MEHVRYYKTVSANTIDSSDFVIPDGETYQIHNIGGNAAVNSEVKVCVVFGTDCLFSTHGDDNQAIILQVTGDGAKEMSIQLHNDSSSTEMIGGHYTWEHV